MNKEDILWLTPHPTPTSVTVNGALDAMELYARYHAELAFEAGYNLAAKHETNQPDDALEKETYFKKYFPSQNIENQ